MIENINLVNWFGEVMAWGKEQEKKRWKTKGGRIIGKNQHGKGKEGCKGRCH